MVSCWHGIIGQIASPATLRTIPKENMLLEWDDIGASWNQGSFGEMFHLADQFVQRVRLHFSMYMVHN